MPHFLPAGILSLLIFHSNLFVSLSLKRNIREEDNLVFLSYFISLSYGARTSFTIFFFLLLQGKGESLGSMERRKHILTIIIIFTVAEKSDC